MDANDNVSKDNVSKDKGTHYDYSIKRNRTGRVFFLFVSVLVFLFLPGVLLHVLLDTLFDTSEWLMTPFYLLSVLIGGFVFSRFLPNYLVEIPQVQGYVTIDLLRALLGRSGKTYVIYGPGLHIAFPWEERSEKSNFSLEVFTIEWSEQVPGQDTQLLIKGSYQFEVDLARSIKFIGVDEKTIESGALDIIKAEVSHWASTQSADDAKKGIKKLNLKLTDIFLSSDSDVTQSTKATHFQDRYGIRTIAVTVSSIDLPPKVQEARDAVDEANQVIEGVARMYGMTADELKAKIGSNEPDGISIERYNEMVDRFAAKSGNATMNIQAIKLNGLEGLGGLLKLLGGNNK